MDFMQHLPVSIFEWNYIRKWSRAIAPKENCPPNPNQNRKTNLNRGQFSSGAIAGLPFQR